MMLSICTLSWSARDLDEKALKEMKPFKVVTLKARVKGNSGLCLEKLQSKSSGIVSSA